MIQEMIDKLSLEKIEKIVGNLTELKESGVYLKGKCLFCENSGFTISPVRQIWYCFSCNKGGDVLAFLCEYHKKSPMDVLEMYSVKCNECKELRTIHRKIVHRNAQLIKDLEQVIQQQKEELKLLREG